MVGEEHEDGDHTHLGSEVGPERWGEEESYFGSYTHFKIHEEMLKVG